VTTLPSGETITATVDVKQYEDSVHGRKLTCVACHPDKSAGYPHPEVTAGDRRAYIAQAAAQCLGCHKEFGNDYDQSVHGEAIAGGNNKAATCIDCHGAHNVADPERLSRKPQICASCHSLVTETYQSSVHGQLLGGGRNDAASCLDCHTHDQSGHSLLAVKNPEGPTADKHVPESCGRCHLNAMETYNSTYHGRAMRLGTSGQAPNCVDCHGAYGVQRVHAAEQPVNETKFANVCAKCHPGATESFASGWMGHEEPSMSWFPVVFFTERFLFFLMTSVVAFGILHVELDLLRSLVRRRKGQSGRGDEEK
jgi:predicted CXXCH cytochrome family protein